ncbi:MAG: transposase [Streptosporangiaceae bacterium]
MPVTRVRGIALPGGDVVDLYAAGDRWTTDPVAGAELVAEGWLLPGLVDAHTHPGAEAPGKPLDEAVLREDLREHVAAGVTLIRAPGVAGDPPGWFGRDDDVPRAVHAGPWIAQHGQFFDGWGRRAGLGELPEMAAAQAARTGWAKVIADWQFAAYDGTAPIEVSSGNRKACRLSMRGNRRLNHAIHMAAVTQIRYKHSDGRACYDKKIAGGKTGKEALRALKRQVSDAIYQHLKADAARTAAHSPRGPGGQPGNDSVASAAGSHPEHQLFGQATPGPAPTLRPGPDPAETTPAPPQHGSAGSCVPRAVAGAGPGLPAPPACRGRRDIRCV